MKKILIFLFGGLTFLIPTWIWAAMVDVAIVSEYHRRLPLYPAGSADPGTYRSYVEAVRGMRYAIRIRNHTPQRIGVVIAVDGRNIISGEMSQLGRGERMYILPPYGSGLYEGWRTARDQVNRFYFTDAPDSYAGAWGDYSAMGVIAVAVFREQGPPQVFYERREEKEGSMGKELPMARSAPPGTGFGERVYSPSVRVDFEAEPFPAERHFIKYEWRETLCRKGIIDCRPYYNRFWDERRGYVPPPPPPPYYPYPRR
jgi:hypothetical protein